MTILFLIFLVKVTTLATPSAPTAKEMALKSMALGALARVEKMRGIKLGKPLKMGVKSKGEITTFIQERLREEYGPVKVKAEGELLKLQGLLPPQLNYGEFITSLLTEQVAGFYDHTRQELHIAEWLPKLMQEPIMAHEILHAIQDAHWKAGELIDSKKYTHDEILAHAALLEGDATILTFNYPRRMIDPQAEDIARSSLSLNMLAASLPLQMSSPQFPVMASAPSYLKQSLIFPYQQGMLFMGAVRQQGIDMKQMAQIYSNPPHSTEQILHPKRYFQRDLPSVVKLPPAPQGWSRPWEGRVGEFHLRQLLMSGLPQAEASEAAEGWDGDYTVLQLSQERSVALTLSTWDSLEEAQAFAAALRKVYEQRKAPRPHMELVQRGMEVAFAFSKDKKLAISALSVALKEGEIQRK